MHTPRIVDPAAPVKRSWIHRAIREWVTPILLVLAIMLPLRSAVADWCDVPTGSMEPTILPGDRIAVNRLAFGLRVPFTESTWIAQWSSPVRGDIVVLHSPAAGSTRLVKRVVGLPGDTIELRANRLIINGVPVSYANLDPTIVAQIDAARQGRHEFAREALPGHAHAIMLTPGSAVPRSFGPVTIPPRQYLVLGDSRDNSADSRAFGLVSQDRIVGRSSWVALSFDPANWYLPRFDRWGRSLD
ncbi:MAG: signal peptidase I [Phycisphaerales bacterium]